MSAPRITVSQSGVGYTLRLTNRGTLGDLELQQQLLKVYYAVNPAEQIDRATRSREEIRALTSEGPLLFNEMVMELDGSSHPQVGGLTVSAARLSATLAKLRELGFEVVQ